MAVPFALIAERRLIDRLMKADAMSSVGAQRLDDLSLLQARRLQRLRQADVIRETQPGVYYLYAPALADRITSRRRRVAVVLAVVLGLFALSVYVAEH